MKTLGNIGRIIVGAVFTFSGFVKAVDPMGSTYKFNDYFIAFGMEWLVPISLFLAIVLAALEFVLGIALIFNSKIRTASWLTLIFMAFFTPLTLVLAITNPVTDCGCFGDALILTNWETFEKNIVLLLLTIVIFRVRKKITTKSSPKEQLILLCTSCIIILGISSYSYNHLPLIDFRPYHVGANIKEGMSIPEGAPTDEYNTILYYERGGTVEEFTQSNYPWQDTTWKFVDSKQVKIKDGYNPPIHDFSISNDLEGDITDQVLNNENYTLIVVARNINDINAESQNQLNNLALYCLTGGYNFICLTASFNEDINNYRTVHQVPYKFYNTDETQLKTMIRSNPGLILIQNGTILKKWHYKDIPEIKDLENNLTASVLSGYEDTTNKLKIISISSIVLLLISFYKIKKLRLVASKKD